MGEGGCNNSAPNDGVELEAMRRDTFTWHPCQIALCSGGLGLIVLHGDSKFEETITDRQDILERVRVRSVPLQGDDCSSIKQGEHVLAAKSSRVKSVFYDARVEEAIQVRHSKRIHCRCSFRIKFLHQVKEEEALTVPSSSIMKLSAKSIHLHPTISTFFGTMEASDDLDSTLYPMNADGINLEVDISMLLEKQIKEISNSTDISGEKFSTSFVFGQVDFKGQSNSPVIEASLKDRNTMFPFLDKFKSSNGSENKQHMEKIMEIPPVRIRSIGEEFAGSRFLSPLAARAALASSRSEFPQSPKFGEDVVKKLFQTSNAPQTDEASNLSSGAQVNKKDKRKKIKEKKTSQPSHSRLTRAKAQTVGGQNEATQMTTSNGTPSTVTRARRVTRFEKTEKIEYNVAVDDNVHDERTKLSASPVDGETSEDSDMDDNRLFGKDDAGLQNGTFMQNAKKQNYPIRLTRSAARLGDEKVTVQSPEAKSEKIVQRRRILRNSSSSETHEVDLLKEYVIVDTTTSEPEEREKNRKSSARVKSTRLGDEKVNVQSPEAKSEKIVQPRRKLRKSSSSETHKVDLLKVDVIVDTKTPEPEEREKNRKSSTRVKSNPKNPESGVGSYQSTRQESSNAKEQGTRFSPRLGSLRQTRSQSKA